MNSVEHAIALFLLIVGVGLTISFIGSLIYALRATRDRKEGDRVLDETAFGDLPKVPEFINRRRNDE